VDPPIDDHHIATNVRSLLAAAKGLDLEELDRALKASFRKSK
jgi:hypothetical protein